MKKKKGFTLVELLAVILILGIIALIAIPAIINIIDESQKGAFKASMENVVRTVESACEMEIINKTEHVGSYVFNNGVASPTLKYKGRVDITGTINVNKSCEVSFTNVTDGTYYATKGSVARILVTSESAEHQSDYQAGYLAGQTDGYDDGYQAGLAAGTKTIKRTLLGSYTGASSITYDATGLTNYQNLTADDFIMVPTKLSGSNGGDGAKSFEVAITKTYNASTGKLVMTGTYGRNSERWTQGWLAFDLYLFTVE
ncbi:MAG TPA: prepilin-type N-terminal cleavage/methylation domain-containing protein [Bacilli bacterium]|nr:prepilin-type N-terminal cleavage/methylation domain-containing protein [Bacilli bacterium]